MIQFVFSKYQSCFCINGFLYHCITNIEVSECFIGIARDEELSNNSVLS